jgi:hypothetical protein
MKKDGLLKPLAFAFVAAIAIYAVMYSGIEHRRTYKGPWQVAFTNDPAGAPAVVINQPALGITNVQITFPGAALPRDPATNQRAFAQPREVPYGVPFGKCLFMDTTFLPGTLVFNLFGHEIQLIPRVLTIDHLERPWRSHEVISLTTTNLSSPPALQ